MQLVPRDPRVGRRTATASSALTRPVEPSLAHGPPVLGRVVDAHTGAPLDGAGLHITGTRFGTISDSAGFLLFTDLASGAYELTVRRMGFATRRDTIRLPLAADSMVEVRLAPRPMMLDDVCDGGLPSVPGR
jgi:hypothetical protein